jgi:hypothetical protein
MIGLNEWEFGEMIRGIVRHPVASIYFDDSCNSPIGNWIWLAPGYDKRGVAQNLGDAIEAAEREMGVE